MYVCTICVHIHVHMYLYVCVHVHTYLFMYTCSTSTGRTSKNYNDNRVQLYMYCIIHDMYVEEQVLCVGTRVWYSVLLFLIFLVCECMKTCPHIHVCMYVY